MKKIQTLALVTALAVSPLALAAKGTAPKCMNGKFNLALVNKDVKGCYNNGEYCLYDLYYAPPKNMIGLIVRPTCEDDDGITISNNTNESYSYDRVPNSMMIAHTAYYGGKKRRNVPTQFKLGYQNGRVVTNCQEFFGSDVQCQVDTRRNAKNGVDVIVTLSKNS